MVLTDADIESEIAAADPLDLADTPFDIRGPRRGDGTEAEQYTLDTERRCVMPGSEWR